MALAKGVLPKPLLQGGSGFDSRAHEMPPTLPEPLEAGTLPTPAISGLLGGISFVTGLGLAEIRRRTEALFLAARERIEALDGFHIYQREQVGAVLLFSYAHLSDTALARALDKADIATRAGLHCAPVAHQALGTADTGAVRLSFSALNTVAELDALWHALKTL